MAGSTATTWTEGRRSLSTCPTPVIVPPVPTPQTSASTSPSRSRQISSAVVRRWISGLAGLLNCWGMNAPRSPRSAPPAPPPRSCRPATASRGPRRRRCEAARCAPGSSPRAGSAPARSRAPRRPSPARSRCCRWSARRSPSARARSAPSRSAASIIATPIRSLTEPPGFRYSSLATTSAPSPSASRPQGDQRRVADRARRLPRDRGRSVCCARLSTHDASQSTRKRGAQAGRDSGIPCRVSPTASRARARSVNIFHAIRDSASHPGDVRDALLDLHPAPLPHRGRPDEGDDGVSSVELLHLDSKLGPDVE